MYYHQWPPVGRGSHSYVCYFDYNYTEFAELSADFSQSVYRWDLMQDTYDENSSEEACDAVARLMSDVGISMDMTYGSNSGASEDDALMALKRYFGYSGKAYKLNRDIYDADEWDQLLVDEISIADVNAVVGMILGSPGDASGDVNGDGEINIADVNAIIDMILGGD